MDYKNTSKRLQQLIYALFEFAEIERKIFYPDGKKKNRLENDVEHSYSLAMCAWYLSQYLPHLNQLLVLKMALAHDIVEVHAGDVMAIGRTEDEEKQKIEREKQALLQLKADWPDFQQLTDAIELYENKETPEAQFVSALDKILPIYLNLLSEGKTWKHYQLPRAEVVKNKDQKTKINSEIHSIWQEIKQEILEHDEYFN